MSGRYKAYGEYKESGVEWLGEIPREWDVTNIKKLTTIVNGSTPKSEVEKYWNGEINWITPSDLSHANNKFIFCGQRSITKAGLFSCGTTVVPSFSVILSCRAPIGSLAISGSELCTNQGCKSLTPNNKMLSKYIYYYLSILSGPLNNLGRGSTFLELSSDDLGNLKIPYPAESAELIAAFLDHETAKIDTLIDKQQQLIELLKEKRQAVISHAVTKGLDPDVPMKDSGVEWVNKIPHGWFTQKLRWSSHIYAGGTPSKTNLTYWENGTIPWINSGAVNQGMILEETTLITHSAYINSSAKWITKGSLVIALAGQGKTKGMVAQVGINTTCNQSMAAIVPWETERARYLFWWLNNNYENIRNMSGGDLRDGLNLEYIGDIHCPKPTHKECNSISLFLDHETAKIDKLIELQLQQIELLKERRTALISAAVTGKIDVRDWQVPATRTESDEVMA